MVDRVRSKCEEDSIFAPKQNERDCPMTTAIYDHNYMTTT